MELSLSHTLHLFNIFRENDGKENCAQVLEEECIRMFGTKSLNDEHVCNVVLGNVVISKNFLRTRTIMVMHSNERGECCLRTLVDRQRKSYDNAVDVVVRLHDRPILVPKVRHLRDLHMFSSAMSHELTI